MYNKIYAGIGSRKTPLLICEVMEKLAIKLANKDCVLRSGGARGADTAFERGCDSVLGVKQIFYIDKCVQRIQRQDGSILDRESNYSLNSLQEAELLASKYHPNWNGLSKYIRKLHTRNVFQILGLNLNCYSNFVLCWTPDGAKTETTSKTGGTGQAIRIANAYGIKVYNLADQEDLNVALNWLGTNNEYI